jgi:hypothetical protein
VRREAEPRVTSGVLTSQLSSEVSYDPRILRWQHRHYCNLEPLRCVNYLSKKICQKITALKKTREIKES